MPAMFATWLRRDRLRWGMSQGEAAWRTGVTRAFDRAMEAGEAKPNSTTFDWIVELYGWPC
jgi:predicted transcriptional regulator